MTSTSRRHAWRAASLALPILLAAGPGGAAGPGPEAEAKALRAGVALIESRRLYAARCAGCHGLDGTGTDEAPVDFSAPQALVRLTRARIEAVLAGGGGGVGHPEVALDDAGRAQAIGYVRNYLMLPAPDADTEIGRAIYAENCSVCHGDRGNAASWARHSLDPAPADFTAHGLADISRREMIDVVAFGEDGTAMMPFAVQLDQGEIAATVDYIRAAFMSAQAGAGGAGGHDHGGQRHAAAGADHDAGRDSPAEDDRRADDDHAEHGHDHDGHEERDMTAAFPHGLVGDPGQGRSFYNNNCAECHGRKGDGEGPRAYFMVTKPENFTSREARAELNREELYEYIGEGVVGTTMPAWEKVLSPQEMANVGEYVFRAFIRPQDFEGIAPAAPGWAPAGIVSGDAKKN